MRTSANWFVSKTKFKGTRPNYVWSRSDNPWCTVEVALQDSETGEVANIERRGETDILFVFTFPDEPTPRLALHIENKLASGKFTPYQLQVYEARAQKWVGDKRYGNYTDWETVLLAPASFYARNAALAQKFGAFISHEEVANHLPAFRPQDV